MLDKNYLPIEMAFRLYEQNSVDGIPFSISVIRNDSERFTSNLKIVNPSSWDTLKYVVKTIRSLLYIVGGYKIELAGDEKLCAKIAEIFSKTGYRSFDANFMRRVFDTPFIVERVKENQIKPTFTKTQAVGQNLNGCKIGFDAGGSDRKVSAVIDGKSVYSEEVIWFPKLNDNPSYHKEEIIRAFKTAASKLPRIDGIGVSTAGIVVNNQLKISSLFVKVPDSKWQTEVQNIYIDCAKALGENIPISVANDGDVTALAGAMELSDNGVLGIAMGTSEAAGYYNTEDGLNGWLNELAFVPVDYNESSLVDEWCGDYGCGVKYFSQDGAIKLAEMNSIILEGTPAEKLKALQEMVIKNDPKAIEVFDAIGKYLGHTLPYYARFYEIKNLLLLGRVMSGDVGNLIIERAKKIIDLNYPELEGLNFVTPNENMKRVGQSYTAALL